MSQAQLFCAVWQALLLPFAWIFAHPDYRRFVQWITALALSTEQHTITGSVLALEPARRLEDAGTLRRNWRLARRSSGLGPRRTGGAGARTDLAWLPCLGR
jgi:hypothetical protein